MTTKDYKLIARAVSATKPDVTHQAERNQWIRTARYLVVALENTYENFDQTKFRADAKMEQPVVAKQRVAA